MYRFSTYIEHPQYHSFAQKNSRKNIGIWNLSTKFATTYSPRFPQEQRAQGESFILSIGIVTLLVTFMNLVDGLEFYIFSSE